MLLIYFLAWVAVSFGAAMLVGKFMSYGMGSDYE